MYIFLLLSMADLILSAALSTSEKSKGEERFSREGFKNLSTSSKVEIPLPANILRISLSYELFLREAGIELFFIIQELFSKIIPPVKSFEI
jgi:hypothetical protein